jgi:hypothetical protein
VRLDAPTVRLARAALQRVLTKLHHAAVNNGVQVWIQSKPFGNAPISCGLTGAAVLMATLTDQTSLPWPDEFPRKIRREKSWILHKGCRNPAP